MLGPGDGGLPARRRPVVGRRPEEHAIARRFEELDAQETRMGLLTLWRRRDPVVEREVYEVKLGDEYLMSSLFTVAEEELARLGLAAAPDRPLDVVVGGLGLGYTAVTALDDDRVGTLAVVDAHPAVIGWHRAGLLPDAAVLNEDARCRLVEADFFAWARGDAELPDAPASYDVVLLDVDHSPRHVLDPSHADLYTVEGLRRMTARLAADGVFALWSDDPPDEDFLSTAREVFHDVEPRVVDFNNPLTGGRSANTVYVARLRSG